MNLEVMRLVLCVCRMDVHAPIPEWAMGGAFFSLTRTGEELSVVCEEQRVPSGVLFEGGWRAIKVAGPLAFHLTGILASIAGPLASAGVSLFAISTFDTDYVLVKQENLEKALQVLTLEGHAFHSSSLAMPS